MKRITLILGVLFAFAAPSVSQAASEWHSEQPVAVGIEVPVPLGEIGDVEFWAPNRGLLITAGNGGVKPGLFAYDGRGWYRYSEVCGGHEGRIAWAGPDDFWTISDQQVGQETGRAPGQHISLCHFENGKVVASYGEPEGQANSYLPMDTAACSSPSDCWFAGQRLPGTVNVGAFHLHWNGSSLTAIPSLTESQPEIQDPGRSVTSLAYEGGRLFESVQVEAGDIASGEAASSPFLLHEIVPASSNPFVSLIPVGGVKYGQEAGAKPTQLQGFQLAADGEGEGQPFAQQLWAIAGAREAPAKVTVLRLGATGLKQVLLQDPEGVFSPGDAVVGAAAEPGSEAAWVAYRPPGEFGSSLPARLARIAGEGDVEESLLLPDPNEGISRQGRAGPIACPSSGQCWMATEKGWLFHLGPDPAPNNDPAMHTLITSRPRDPSLPSELPTELPEDNSGAESGKGGGETPALEPFPEERPPGRLLTGLHQKLIDKTLLVLTFDLHGRAHVQLRAKHGKKVVAKTPRYTMKKGHQKISLRLDPKHWPTHLDLEAHPIKGGK
jgi:hypothetical protein